ncbi:conserved hypothetical protein [Ricinus communis]|uniref:Uncharacterized protein n=1 Tax=Ricinus communis TaxID=3988 RepID=B9TEW7_RICCO|nr:conserved hypothetical protein [Ricinus communis]
MAPLCSKASATPDERHWHELLDHDLEHQFRAAAHADRREVSDEASAGYSLPAGNQGSERALPARATAGDGLRAHHHPWAEGLSWGWRSPRAFP